MLSYKQREEEERKVDMHIYCGKGITTADMEFSSTMHLHDYFELLYLFDGEAVMNIGDNRYKITKGQIALIKRLEMHDLVPIAFPYSRICIHIDFEALCRLGIPQYLFAPLSNHPRDWCNVFDLRELPEICKVIEEIHEDYSKKSDTSEEMFGILLHRLLLLLYRSYPERFIGIVTDESMEEAKIYIEEHAEEEISVSLLAKKNYLTTSHFIVKFKKYTGYTPYKYRNLCRMNYARKLLTTSDASLSEIADECGFSDLNGFVRCFRETMNLTPKKYREMSRTKGFEK